MARSKSSSQWLREHFSDPYVKQAQALGYRSRAVFKLQDIQKKYKVIRPNDVVIDLGAAPGGWSQIAKTWLGKQGQIIALDILPMEPLSGVTFLQGDFREASVMQALTDLLADRTVNVVLSDIAPNMSGHKSVDILKAMHLSELVLEFTKAVKAPILVIKLFHGEGFDAYLRDLRATFKTVHCYKPDASRDRSRESYAVCIGLR